MPWRRRGSVAKREEGRRTKGHVYRGQGRVGLGHHLQAMRVACRADWVLGSTVGWTRLVDRSHSAANWPRGGPKHCSLRGVTVLMEI